MGIRYSFTKSDRILKEYGVKSPALPGLRGGANPATWLQNRVVGGPNDFIDCSGYTKLSLYVAYNYQTTAGCSGSYAKDSNGDGLADADPNLMIVPLNQLQPGDFLTISLVCNSETTPGHIAIYVETLPNGKIKTLESTAGKDANGKILSGYREREANYFPYASRYIGPGSPGK